MNKTTEKQDGKRNRRDRWKSRIYFRLDLSLRTMVSVYSPVLPTQLQMVVIYPLFSIPSPRLRLSLDSLPLTHNFTYTLPFWLINESKRFSHYVSQSDKASSLLSSMCGLKRRRRTWRFSREIAKITAATYVHHGLSLSDYRFSISHTVSKSCLLVFCCLPVSIF